MVLAPCAVTRSLDVSQSKLWSVSSGKIAEDDLPRLVKLRGKAVYAVEVTLRAVSLHKSDMCNTNVSSRVDDSFFLAYKILFADARKTAFHFLVGDVIHEQERISTTSKGAASCRSWSAREVRGKWHFSRLNFCRPYFLPRVAIVELQRHYRVSSCTPF